MSTTLRHHWPCRAQADDCEHAFARLRAFARDDREMAFGVGRVWLRRGVGNVYWLTEKTNSPSVQNVVAKNVNLIIAAAKELARTKVAKMNR